MGDVWTMKQLENTDDIDFAITILNERANKLNPYTPLSKKLYKTIKTLEHIKTELPDKARKNEVD